MTNFQGLEKPKTTWLSPERLLIAIPVAAGALLALLLLFLLWWPLFQEFQRRSAVVAELEQQEQELPMLRLQVDKLLQRQDQAKRHQEALRQTVGSQANLNTLVAALNRMADATGAVLLVVKPLAASPEPEPPAVQPAQPANAAEEPAQDPLLIPGLEKRSAELQIQGTFAEVLDFLRRLEALNTAVMIDDLELSADDVLEPDEPTLTPQVLVLLKLTITSYGRGVSAD